MKTALFLLIHHISFYRWRVVVLAVCLFFVCIIPFGVDSAVSWYVDEFHDRAESTPLVVGRRGNRYDLVLSTLYFRTDYPARIPVSMADEADRRNYGIAIPLLLGHSIQRTDSHQLKLPLVASTPDYYDFRNLSIKQGGFPLLPGEIVLGARAAERLGVKVGERLVNEPKSTLDFSRSAQFALNVTGVLLPTGTVDDDVCFTSLQTVWILEGIGHGHQEAKLLLEKEQGIKTGDSTELSASVTAYNELTAENLEDFHFHGNPDEFPITAFLIVPETKKQKVLAIGFYRLHDVVQLIIPLEVATELFSLVFQIKRFFTIQAAGMMMVAVLLIVFIARLSRELRKEEFSALQKIGAPAPLIWCIQWGELLLILAGSIGMAYVLSLFIPDIIKNFFW